MKKQSDHAANLELVELHRSPTRPPYESIERVALDAHYRKREIERLEKLDNLLNCILAGLLIVVSFGAMWLYFVS